MNARTLALLALLLVATPATAELRGDEEGPRDFDYNDEYFLNLFSYRWRLTHRWQWGEAARVPWRWMWGGTAVGYHVSAGSVRTNELFLHQEAIVRLPFSSHLTGEYRFLETEDHESRYHRSEVEVLFRFFRPPDATPLLSTLGRTPPPDGLFVGGQGLLDADKENADLGLVLGWRGDVLGVRLDVIRPEFFYNGKVKDGTEYATEPLALRAKAGLNLLDGDLELLAWFEEQLPTRFERRRGDQVTFRYRQRQGGLAARWWVAHGVRAEVRGWAETTRERQRSRPAPALDRDIDRDAMQLFAQAEVDVTPLLASSSRARDVVLLGAHVEALDETARRLLTGPETVLRRGGGYAELGYVLGLPTFSDEYRFGLRVATQNGFISMRDVRPDEDKHTVTRRFMSKLGIGLETLLHDDLGYLFFQLTFRCDQLTFGGGNAQVMMRF